MRSTRLTSNANHSRNQPQNILTFLNNFKISQIDDSTTVLINRMANGCIRSKEIQGYMVKDIVVQNAEELREIQSTLKIHLGFPEQLFMPLLDFQITHNQTNQTQGFGILANQNNIEDSQTLIRAIYQYSQCSLQVQLRERVQKKTAFVEDEIWFMLTSLVQSLAFLQKNQIVYGVLGLDRMLVTSFNKEIGTQKKCKRTRKSISHCLNQLKNKKIRLLDPSAAAMNPLQILPGRMYSPQVKMYNYQSNGFQNQKTDEMNQMPEQIDMFKSDVYVLGLCILQLGLLMDFNTQNLNLQPAYSTTSQKIEDGSIIKKIKKPIQMDEQMHSDDQCSNDSFNPSRVRKSKQRQHFEEQKNSYDNTIKFSNITARRNQRNQSDEKSQMIHQSSQKKSKTSSNLGENLELTIPFHLGEFTNNYSEQLAMLVASMLSASPQHRPNFTQIQNHLFSLINSRNIPGIQIVLNRQLSDGKKESIQPLLLQPLQSDLDCQPDRIVRMQFIEQRQIPDCNDYDAQELQSDRSQKDRKKCSAKHSLSQKKKNQRFVHKVTEYERARQNFIANPMINQQFYEEGSSAQNASSNDISGSPDQNSCSDEGTSHQESYQIKQCKKCDHFKQESRKESKKKGSQNQKRTSKQRKQKEATYRTKKSNGSHQALGLQFNAKKHKNGKNRNQNRKVQKQSSFNKIANQNANGQATNKINQRKQNLSQNSQPSSLLSSFELKNSRNNYQSNQEQKNLSRNLIVNKNKQQGVLRETQQFKHFLNSQTKNLVKENIDFNQQTKYKYYKGKVNQLNIKTVARDIFEDNCISKHNSNQGSLSKNKENLNKCLEKCISSRQLQRIQSQQSRESQSSSEDQYYNLRHNNQSANQKSNFPKPTEIQTFYQAKAQIRLNNPNTFKQAMGSLQNNPKPLQQIQRSNLMARPKNNVFIRTVQATQEQQIFTDPKLLKLIKDQIGSNNLRNLQNFRNQSNELRQTMGEYGLKNNLEHALNMNEKDKKIQRTFAQYSSLQNQEPLKAGFNFNKQNMRYNKYAIQPKRMLQ